MTNQGRLDRERQTIRAMISIYCRGHHSPSSSLCQECEDLLAYSLERIDRCPSRERKPTCARCTIHCYKPVMREQVRRVMRYAGPRMLLRHPMLAARHLLDDLASLRKARSGAK